MAAVPVAATLLVAAIALSNSPAASLAHKNKKQQKQKTSLPSNMWVDTPQNTALRNDRVDGAQSTREIDEHVRETYKREAASHPGVHLAAVSAFG